MDRLTLELLHAAVSGEYAGIRRVTKLQPAGDPKIYPPTYEGGEYATEERKVRTDSGVTEVKTVLLDSVQSQANRMELALLRAYDAGLVKFPMLAIDFKTGEEDPILAEIGRLTALELPHRVTDALLRDSEYNGKPFRSSEIGKKLDTAKSANATPIFELCPTALIFGFWDSTGPRGGLGAKVQRALASEIVGYDVAFGVRPASRIDPVVNEGVEIYARRGGGWTADRAQAEQDEKNEAKKYGKKGKASEINLGNVTPSLTHEDERTHKRIPNHGGVTIGWAEQTTVLSLAALRRLRFPIDGATQTDVTQEKIDDAARTVLAALALAAICSLDRDGYDLRSRCLLDGKPGAFEFVGRGETKAFELDGSEAYSLVDAAAQRAKGLGLPWPLEPKILKPSADLRLLVQKSRQKSMAAAAAE
jgi:CRISPR-associated protein Csb1